ARRAGRHTSDPSRPWGVVLELSTFVAAALKSVQCSRANAIVHLRANQTKASEASNPKLARQVQRSLYSTARLRQSTRAPRLYERRQRLARRPAEDCEPVMDSS